MPVPVFDVRLFFDFNPFPSEDFLGTFVQDLKESVLTLLSADLGPTHLSFYGAKFPDSDGAPAATETSSLPSKSDWITWMPRTIFKLDNVEYVVQKIAKVHEELQKWSPPSARADVSYFFDNLSASRRSSAGHDIFITNHAEIFFWRESQDATSLTVAMMGNLDGLRISAYRYEPTDYVERSVDLKSFILRWLMPMSKVAAEVKLKLPGSIFNRDGIRVKFLARQKNLYPGLFAMDVAQMLNGVSSQVADNMAKKAKMKSDWPWGHVHAVSLVKSHGVCQSMLIGNPILLQTPDDADELANKRLVATLAKYLLKNKLVMIVEEESSRVIGVIMPATSNTFLLHNLLTRDLMLSTPAMKDPPKSENEEEEAIFSKALAKLKVQEFYDPATFNCGLAKRIETGYEYFNRVDEREEEPRGKGRGRNRARPRSSRGAKRGKYAAVVDAI